MNTLILQRDFPKQALATLVGGITTFTLFVIVWVLGYQLMYAGKIFPGVSVGGVDVSGLSRNEAALKLSQTLSYPINGKILFRDGEKVWVASPSELGMVFDPSASALAAFNYGRKGGLFVALTGQINSRGLGSDVAPVVLFDQRVAYNYLQNIGSQVNQPVVEANLKIEGTNVLAQSGQYGRALNLDATLIFLGAQLQTFRDGEVTLVIQETAPKLLDVSSQADAARRILSAPLVITVPNVREGDPGPWTFDVPVLANMMAVNIVDVNGAPQMQVGLDPVAIRNSLTDLKIYVDRIPKNARFIFDDATGQLQPISASAVGRVMDVEASIIAINEALLRGEHTVNLVLAEELPLVQDTATGAELGIVELVAQQTSYFYGSSTARVQNITAAAANFHGVLVAPGEIFSMSRYMEDISLENGYAEALIIYGGRTIKGVGGGVCQVSTTLFRTVFFAGFPIVERYSHAYRVSYYELVAGGARDTNLAGLDATVFFPLVDFKFQNDTPYWLLMETYVNANSITWKFYSTSDGRNVIWDTTGPTNTVPPPEPIFEENEELEFNEIEQVDYPAEGADVTVTRTVWRDGTIFFTDQFITYYQPWAAVCQYGPGTENPDRKARRANLCTS